jgi:hypothetical protein
MIKASIVSFVFNYIATMITAGLLYVIFWQFVDKYKRAAAVALLFYKLFILMAIGLVLLVVLGLWYAGGYYMFTRQT